MRYSFTKVFTAILCHKCVLKCHFAGTIYYPSSFNVNKTISSIFTGDGIIAVRDLFSQVWRTRGGVSI